MGDALVFRNAGGRVTDDVEVELSVLWMMAAALSNRLGVEQAQIDGLANADHVQRIHEDIECLRKSPLVPKGLLVSGYIYRVEDSTVEEVVAPAPLQSM